MRETEYVAALEMGTSKIIAMSALKSDQGILSILHTEKTPSENCIRRGVVYNIDDTTQKVKHVLRAVSTKSPSLLGKIYVGIGGQSIHSQEHTIKRNMAGEVVSRETIDSIYEECKGYRPDGWDVLAITTPEYSLDGRIETKPVGVACQSIEATYRLILGRPSLKLNIEKSITKGLFYDIIDYFVIPLATAEAVLTQSEKERGCALVEFGAGVTYVSVYKNNILRYLVTIPIGGNVITKDLCDANLSEEEAELLKKGGDAGDISYDSSKFEDILEARCYEIVENIAEQIRQSNYAGALGAGIIITGGASEMFEVRDMLKKRAGMEVRQATTKKTLVNNLSIWAEDPACSAVIGMLALANENCAKPKREDPFTSTPSSSQSTKPEPTISEGRLFVDDEDTKRKAEELRKKKEEEREKIKAIREEERKRREEKRKGFFSRFGKWKDGASKGVERLTGELFGNEDTVEEHEEDDYKDGNNNETHTQS